ncbi:TRAP transporter fused permease subunit [Aerococcaceae bacterium zg-B36]|uniref:TRAP transporter permease n=1 Tax=Aerococcaceae bacterium zg-252 TaxID=2796928 RepID=UPI001BD8FFB1|nr:TRAP transporter fused permease subunit [Aerococcaceae bacterium zg-B36]
MGNDMNTSNTMNQIINKALLLIAIALAIFHLYSASFGVMPAYMQTSIHWSLVGSFIILNNSLKFKFGRLIDIIIVGLIFFVSFYNINLQEKFIQSAGIYSKNDVIVGIIALIIAIEAARRVIGIILPLISIIFITYAYFGNLLPGMLKTAPFTINRIGIYLFTSNDGLFGQTLYVSAQYIFLFVLFGSILSLTGAGKFFVDIAFALTGGIKGGPAQAAVYSSMLMGTINGSGAANVVTTGTFTIPLMKQTGFKSAFAGAVEAVASNGGQIMPPVMGAVAFLMAEMTGISYGTIALAAFPTAALYYLTLSMSVYVEAGRKGVTSLPKDKRLDARAVFKEGWLFLVPLLVLIIMLISGYSAQKSGFYAIIVSLIVGLIKDPKQITVKNLIEAFFSAAKGIAPIAAACILAGVVMGVLNLTGLGLKISSLIIQISGGNVLLALVLAMLTSLVLGMGLPTSAAYMVLAILVAPALVEMGIPVLAAHLFILYFGALSTITPPVALSTFAAAGIAESNIWETGIQAMKLAIAGFIIPFIFCFAPELLLIGDISQIFITIFTAVLGCIGLSIGLGGWFLRELNLLQRILVILGSIFMIVPNILISIVGFCLMTLILYTNLKLAKP